MKEYKTVKEALIDFRKHIMWLWISIFTCVIGYGFALIWITYVVA